MVMVGARLFPSAFVEALSRPRIDGKQCHVVGEEMEE